MAMSREDVYAKVQGVLVDALGVDEEQVTPNSRLKQDLGAESIDFLDIVFRLEKAFTIKIPRGELVPENVLTDPNYVQNGRVTPAGMTELKKRMPYVDLSEFEKDPQVDQLPFTVDAVVSYVQSKLPA
ncbi:MAG TPA: acyl carrier protein [Tepidisphaeraceae bacterium]|jgi:acyl carrier protein|nr:acyl carrier protein [Tepidisphaeraceae bacterium]